MTQDFNGYVRVSRRMLNWEWFSDGNTFHVFMFLLLSASKDKCNWRGMELEKGQVFTSYSKIAVATGLTVDDVKNAITNLVSTGEVTMNELNEGKPTEDIIVSVSKYSDYQHSGSEDDGCEVVPLSSKDDIPYREMVDLWNKTCTSLPKVVSLSQKRKTQIKSRCKSWKKQLKREDYLVFANELFHKIEQSDFLTGRTGNSWRADFDWIFKNDANWLKVWEGNYSNRGNRVGVSVPLRNGSEFTGSEDDFLKF